MSECKRPMPGDLAMVIEEIVTMDGSAMYVPGDVVSVADWNHSADQMHPSLAPWVVVDKIKTVPQSSLIKISPDDDIKADRAAERESIDWSQITIKRVEA